MEARPDPLTDLLLQTGKSVLLRVDADDRLLRVAGESLLNEWLQDRDLPQPGASLAEVLRLLFDDAHAGRILAQHCALRTASAPVTAICPMLPARPLRLAATRWFDVTCARFPDEQSSAVVIADRTRVQQLADAAAVAGAANDLAITVLRTEPAVLRQFLQTASAANSFIRSTLRQPARTQETLREKLGLLRSEALSLRNAAEQLALRGIASPCQALMTDLDALLSKDALSGDDMLPLALRLDPISAAIGAASSLDEQRPAPALSAPVPAVTTRANAPRPVAAWHEICEQRANDLIQRFSVRFGVLARMRMKGSALVPERYHRQIESVLEPLLLNATKHGIETPEQRLAVDKPAAGTITITFRNLDAGGLEMIVHDDGRGFDLTRIESAALASGLLVARTDVPPDPRELVGMIFKPGFSTAALPQLPGTGQGMALLRETLNRQGGNVSVATKPLHYTQFVLRLPVRDAAIARQRPSRRESAGASAPQP
jgi:signal transduction histidine kinase